MIAAQCGCRYGGALKDGGVLETGSVKDVTLMFECLRPGTALVELKVATTPHNHNRHTIQFMCV